MAEFWAKTLEMILGGGSAGLLVAILAWMYQRRKLQADVEQQKRQAVLDTETTVDQRWNKLCDQYQERIDQMSKLLVTLQTRLGEQETQIAELWTRLHQSEIAVTVRDTKIVALEASAAAKDMRIAALEARVTEMQEKIRMLEAENKSLRGNNG